MADTSALPKPEKRKAFTARDVAAVFIKCEARCAKCREKVSLGNYAIDHIQRLDALGAHELSNWQLLCSDCHGEKTRVDNREAKKGARVRGEKGQRARRAKNGPQIVSRNSFQPRLLAPADDRETRAPGSWSNKPDNYVSPLSKKYRDAVKARRRT